MIEISIKKALDSAQGKISLEFDKTLEDGSFVTLFGKSGAGKTTILRILAGLASPDAGKIIVGDEVWFDSDKKINLPTQKRGIGLVFQEYALFPNMSVFENLKYALQDKKRLRE